MSIELLIGYLTDANRNYMFEQFCRFLNKSTNKSRFELMILYNGDTGVVTQIEETVRLELSNIVYHIVVINTNINYLDKIKHLTTHALNHGIEYCMKIDNDIIINNFMLDYMIENMEILKNKNNLLLCPDLSSGIPTVDSFVESFLNEDEKRILHNIFINTSFPHIWGYNYNMLNKCTINKNDREWVPEYYYNTLALINYHYKGIHPIRINKEAICYLNDVILSKKDLIYKKMEYDMYVNFAPYLCNSVFIIKAQVYNTIINDRSLYVDIFDEVPVNKYCDIHNLKKICIRNSFTVHIMYNVIDDYLNLEKEFVKKFFS